jgi:putative pyruvate formate lyase activating enzyme
MMWALLRPDAISVLEEPRVRKALFRYVEILRGKRKPKFIVSKSIPVSFNVGDSTENLWALHNKILEEWPSYESIMEKSSREINSHLQQSFLDLKIELAKRILKNCHFCPRRCGIDRTAGKLGWCRLGHKLRFSTAFAHMGEEPELVPSGTIFTIGCNLRCLHCQNWTISQQFEEGVEVSAIHMSKIVEKLADSKCRNINMVGGDPTPWLHAWLETFKYVEKSIATVWNSNTYYGDETAKLLAGFADVYLLDFKYGNNDCAERLSSAPRYVEVCQRNHILANKYGELIIRVLVLPGHLECCCKPILEWIGKNLGLDVRVNIMWQYRPEWRAQEAPELGRRLSADEKERSLEIARSVGLRNYIT